VNNTVQYSTLQYSTTWQSWLAWAHLWPGRHSVKELHLGLVPPRAVEPHKGRPVLEPELASLSPFAHTSQNTAVNKQKATRTNTVSPFVLLFFFLKNKVHCFQTNHFSFRLRSQALAASTTAVCSAVTTAHLRERSTVEARRAHLELRVVRGTEERHRH